MTTSCLPLGPAPDTSLEGPVGGWDAAVDGWFFDERTPLLDQITEWGSRLGDTPR